MKKQYTLGFISHSKHCKELRSPIWWEHLIGKNNHPLIKEFLFEQEFGVQTFQSASDSHLIRLGCSVLDRISLLRSSDIVISLKPKDEWEYMKPGSTLVGWFNHLKTPLKNSRDINFIDLESIMITVAGRQQKLLYRNAYVAGECAVAQTLFELQHLDPSSPAIAQEERLAVVLGYGNLGIGATQELLAQGFKQIIVFTQRQPDSIEDKLEGVEYRQMQYSEEHIYEFNSKGFKQPLIYGTLAQADLIVNATIPSHPEQLWNFIPTDEFIRLKSSMAFVDPVHYPRHGGDFTHPTQLDEPVKLIRKSGTSIWYNGCNAMPSYRPAYASHIISKGLLKHLDVILESVERKVPITT